MRHHCSRCSSEFFDDSPPSSPPARVFCVFCGAPLPLEGDASERSVPFSPDFPREDAFALGVIGGDSSEFPDTLKQFRAPGGRPPPRPDSLSPHAGGDERELPVDADDGQVARFWASLALGLGVGAVAAALLSQRNSPPESAASAALGSAAAVAPALALSGCAVGNGAPAASAAAVPAPSLATPSATASVKVAVTPALERRFWLDRARSAQRQYRVTEAERSYRRVLALSPRDSEALAGIGELALLRGAPALADAQFREALESNPDYLPALVGLADLHWQSGQADAARQEYSSIVERYAEDLYPPYVKLRLEAEACVPACR